MNRERRLRRELASLMQADCPPLTGRQLLGLKSSISAIPADLAEYEAAIARFRAAGAGACAASRTRVLLTGAPLVHGAERVLDIIEGSGGLVVCMENCTGLKPLLEDVEETAADPLRALAEHYFRLPCSVMTPNDRRLDALRRLAAEYRPQCVVELIWQACLTYDVRVASRAAAGGDGVGFALSADRNRLFAVRFGADRLARGGPFRDGPRRRRRTEMRQPMNAILYSSPFVPVEWIVAHGLRPVWLPRRAAPAPREGAPRGICPWAAAMLRAAVEETEAVGIVVAATCDQMRRAAELMERRGRLPVFLFNVPATRQNAAAGQWHREELRRLGRFFERLGGKPPAAAELAGVMRRYEAARCAVCAAGEGLSGRRFAEAVAAVRGELPASPPPAERPTSNRFRLALVGGPLLAPDWEIFDAVEKMGARFVLDATEGGERTLPASFDPQRTMEDPLGELADAYFGAIPDVFQRPNDDLHRWLARELAGRRVQAIVVHRCVWCDLSRAETARVRQSCSLPLLELTAVGEEGAAAGGDAGRLESLLEILP